MFCGVKTVQNPISVDFQSVIYPSRHSTHKTQRVAEEKIFAIIWPTRSPDFNPIQYVWDTLVRENVFRHTLSRTKNCLNNRMGLAVSGISQFASIPVYHLAVSFVLLGDSYPLLNSLFALYHKENLRHLRTMSFTTNMWT
ncbi:hypothetical protein TNCV_2734401 [Trichonephila clavipes]|nr:hypothetical protein TNCV_2734401 [Trichonephila clavipes]